MSEDSVAQELSPRPLMRILGDFANSQILDASLEYDFFSLIHRGLQTAEEIARAAGTDLRATRIVLDSLPALGLVEKRAGKYFPARFSTNPSAGKLSSTMRVARGSVPAARAISSAL